LDSIHRAEAAAGPGRSEHRNVDILIPIARQRESRAGPNVPCERRTDPAEPCRGTDLQAPAPALRHRKTGESPRVYAAFLQSAPIVLHTRGFTPGWYAVPRWGTPNASPSSSFPASGGPDPRSPTEETDWANSSNPLKVPGWACLQVRWPKRLPAAAGRGRSEHWKRTTNPLAQSAKSDLPQSFPASAGPGPRSPVEAPIPRRQPQHSATAKQVRAPGCMRRSFRTLRLCAIPGVSPRAGMRCPVGALQTPHHPQSPHRLRVPTPLSAITTTHRINDDCFSSTATIKPSHRGTYPQSTKRQRDRAGASIGTSTS